MLHVGYHCLDCSTNIFMFITWMIIPIYPLNIYSALHVGDHRNIWDNYYHVHWLDDLINLSTECLFHVTSEWLQFWLDYVVSIIVVRYLILLNIYLKSKKISICYYQSKFVISRSLQYICMPELNVFFLMFFFNIQYTYFLLAVCIHNSTGDRGIRSFWQSYVVLCVINHWCHTRLYLLRYCFKTWYWI